MDSGSLPLLVPESLAFRSELVWKQVSSGSEMRSGSEIRKSSFVYSDKIRIKKHESCLGEQEGLLSLDV